MISTVIATYLTAAAAVVFLDVSEERDRGSWRDTVLLSLLWPAWVAMAMWCVMVAFLGRSAEDDEVEW